VALQKQRGVEAVEVSLEKAIVDVRLRAGNGITLSQIRDIIKSNGFTSREANLTAVGTIVERGGSLLFEVSGTKIALRVVANAAAPAAFEQARGFQDGRSVELTGTVTASQHDEIAVRAVRQM
jgi:hypothetical protein